MKRLRVSLMAAVFLITAGAVLAQAQQPYQEGSMTQQSATDPQPSTTPQQPAATPSSSAPADQPSTTPATQTDPSTTPASSSMPKTASPLPLVGLGGLMALAGGLLIRPRRTA